MLAPSLGSHQQGWWSLQLLREPVVIWHKKVKTVKGSHSTTDIENMWMKHKNNNASKTLHSVKCKTDKLRSKQKQTIMGVSCISDMEALRHRCLRASWVLMLFFEQQVEWDSCVSESSMFSKRNGRSHQDFLQPYALSISHQLLPYQPQTGHSERLDLSVCWAGCLFFANVHYPANYSKADEKCSAPLLQKQKTQTSLETSACGWVPVEESLNGGRFLSEQKK